MAAQHRNQTHLHSISNIGIIGAGISGIAAAKQLSSHSPVVFEATDSIGGVWKHCSYNSTKLQTPRCDFEFSDYPWSERDNANFPSHVEVLDYLHDYATHFDLLKFVKFGSRVLEIRYVGDDGTTQLSENSKSGEYGNLLTGHPVWEVGVQSSNNPNSTIQWYAFEFIVVCIGKYGDIPRMPSFPRNKGQEVFQGKVMHSMDYSKLDQEAARELVKGKKVAVIGYKKSAIDLALECAESNQGGPMRMLVKVSASKEVWTQVARLVDVCGSYHLPHNVVVWTLGLCGVCILPLRYMALDPDVSWVHTDNNSVHNVPGLGPEGQPCTMVVRTLHWTVPSYWIWGLPFFLFYSTRSSQFLHERPNQSFLKALFCLLSSPMRKAVSKFIESYLMWKLPLVKYGLKPEHPFLEDYASCQMAILPENFFPEADKGNIQFKRASKWWFWNGGIEFEDSTKLEADVVLLATGYEGKKKLQSVLPEPFRSLMLDSSGTMPLYRGTIHPLIPNMAFVGFIESVSNLHTAELRCKWLSRVVDNEFKLPTVEEMLDQISREMEVMKRTTRFYKRHCISTFSINHSDEICQEMGWKSWRKSNWLSEAFCPYNSRDYNEQKED